MAYDLGATESYIRQAALQRGIDPDIAVRVAKSEGLARGVYQSNVVHPRRGREPSYGPFQLLVGGTNGWPTGMGNDFVRATGLDPSDPANVNATIDFALDGAAANGWGAWYGAKHAGISNRAGIGGNAAPIGVSTSAPRAAPGSFRAAQEIQPAAYVGVGSVASSTSNAPIPKEGDPPMASNYGSLGGLGGVPVPPEEGGVRGFLRSDAFGDWLGAMGASLMSSPGSNPLENMPAYMLASQRRRDGNQERMLEREQLRQQQAAIGKSLEYAGFSPEQAQTFAVSPTAASTAISARKVNEDRERQNTSLAYLQREYPHIASAVESGAIDAAQGVKLAFDERQSAKGSDESFFGSPVPIKNPDGTISYGQIGNKGSFKPIELGEGQAFAPPTTRIDTGTEILITDQAGGVISRVPKDNYTPAVDSARGGVEGKAAGERTTTFGAAEATAQRTLDTLDRLEKHPGLSSAVGWQAALPDWLTAPSGSDAAGFMTVHDQVQGQAFLQAFESLKGGGQITEIEGQKATAAITRINRGLSEVEYRQAIAELREVVNSGLDRARRGITVESISNPGATSGTPSPSTSPGPARTATGVTWSVD